MMQRGYLQLFRWRGVPVRAHWTVPLGALLFTGGALVPFAWLAFFALILAHELGHAVFALRRGHQVTGIDITGFGGLCRWSGYPTDKDRAIIAWGGVVAQAAVFVATMVVVVLLGYPRGPLDEVADVFLRTNVMLAALNLLPFAPLDGAEAWGILRHLRRGRKPAEARVPTGSPAPRRAAAPPPSPEIAELLRRLGDEAGRARRRS